MPLSMVEIGRNFVIEKIRGNDKVASFLESLGLVPGSEVSVVAHNSSGVILNVKGSRIALGREMANKILV